jgi:hypothetical protein
MGSCLKAIEGTRSCNLTTIVITKIQAFRCTARYTSDVDGSISLEMGRMQAQAARSAPRGLMAPQLVTLQPTNPDDWGLHLATWPDSLEAQWEPVVHGAHCARHGKAV